MTRLPEKNVLDGSKLPKTTTGEMKDALGSVHDFLEELLGTDSSDTEAARKKLGIDLPDILAAIDAKADQNVIEAAVETAIQDKADKAALESLKQVLEKEIMQGGVPVGTIVMFTAREAPAGYLKADGSAVGRETYPDLFAAVGTTFGEGDGATTFNLPDLIGRFAQGSAVPGTVKEAGLPNIAATASAITSSYGNFNSSGAFTYTQTSQGNIQYGAMRNSEGTLDFDASHSNPIYGASDTVQPPALTLLPCIRAFGAVVNAGQVDVTALAGEVSAPGDRLDALTGISIGTAETVAGTVMEMAVPAGAKRVCLNLKGLSTNGASLFGIQLGDAGGVVVSG